MVLTRGGKGRGNEDITPTPGNADAHSISSDDSGLERADDTASQVNGERRIPTEAGDLTNHTAHLPTTDPPNGTSDHGQEGAVRESPSKKLSPDDEDVSDGARNTRTPKTAKRATRSAIKSPPGNGLRNANPEADEAIASSTVSESIETEISISPQSVQKKTAKKKAPKGKKAQGTKPRRSDRLRRQGRDDRVLKRPLPSGLTLTPDSRSPTFIPKDERGMKTITNTGFGQTPVFGGGTKGLSQQEIDDDFDEIDERQARNQRRAQREAQINSDPDETEEETPPPVRFRGPRPNLPQTRNSRRWGRDAARNADFGGNTNAVNTTRTIKAATPPKSNKSHKKASAKKADRKNGPDDESDDDPPGPSKPPTKRTPKKTKRAQEVEAQKNVAFEESGDNSDSFIKSTENREDKRTITATKTKSILKVSEVISSTMASSSNTPGNTPATRKRKVRDSSYRANGELTYLDDKSDNQLNMPPDRRKRARQSPEAPTSSLSSLPSSSPPNLPRTPHNRRKRAETPEPFDDPSIYDINSSGSSAASRRQREALAAAARIFDEQEDEDAVNAGVIPPRSRKRARRNSLTVVAPPNGISFSGINGRGAEETAEADDEEDDVAGPPGAKRTPKKRRK